MCDTVAFECVRQKVQTVAVLGTIYTMEDGLYEESLRTSGIQPVIPDETLRKKLNDMIFQELVPQALCHKNIASLAQELQTIPCDAYLLGCSELPAVYDPSNLKKPCIDPTLTLVRAALDYAKHP